MSVPHLGSPPGTLGPVSTQGPTVQFETASWGRRILALFVDWFASTLVVIFALGGLEAWSESRPSGF